MSPLLYRLLEAGESAISTLPGNQVGWLREIRESNLAALSTNGLPTTRNEAWKYTSLRGLENCAFSLANTIPLAVAIDWQHFEIPKISGPRLVFVNGTYRADLSNTDEIEEGISLQPLSKVLDKDGESLRFFLHRYFNSSVKGFARLNTALAGDGVVLRVSRETRAIVPIHLVFIGSPVETDFVWHLRNIIELGENSTLTIIEHYLGTGPHKHFSNIFNQVVLGEHARLNWFHVQDETEQANIIQCGEFTLATGAALDATCLELGAQLARMEIKVDLSGSNASTHIRGVTALHGRRHNDIQLSITHSAPECTSEVFWRGVADDRARGIFQGNIIVNQEADGADAQLSNKNLLLSPHAQINTKPVLEIYTDDVKASHGATVGQLDEQSLFYLQARGISSAQARKVLTQAFCNSVLSNVIQPEFRDFLQMLLMAHLPNS